MKAHILKLLRASGDVVSGNAICARLGASRVAVWKHIQKLQELGYDIESGARGLPAALIPGQPAPLGVPGPRSSAWSTSHEAPSTMDLAKDLARKGCPAFTTVVAGRQTQGRGRLRRVWSSEEGGLYFTVVLRPRIPVRWSSRVNFLASLTLASILRQGYGVDAGLKWPNDILVGGRKLCGLLSEMESEGEQVNFINVGIGLNVNNDPPEVRAAGGVAQGPAGARGAAARTSFPVPGRAGAGHRRRVVGQGDRRLENAFGDAQPAGAHRHRARRIPAASRWMWMKTARCCCGRPTGRWRTILYGDCFLQA